MAERRLTIRVSGYADATPPPSPPTAATNLGTPSRAGYTRSPERVVRATPTSTPRSSLRRDRRESRIRASTLPPCGTVLEVHCMGSPSLPRRHDVDVGSPVAGRSPPPSPGPLPVPARQAPRGTPPAGAMDDVDDELALPPLVNRGVQAPEPAADRDVAVDHAIQAAAGDVAGEESNPDDLDRPVHVEARNELGPVRWLPPGDLERVATLAYVTINDAPMAYAPQAYIRDALQEHAAHVSFQMSMSNRAHMLLQFDTRAHRDEMVAKNIPGPLGGHLKLEKAEITSNKFVIRCTWLLALAAADFPEEHWNLQGIPAVFSLLGPVVEIDPANFSHDHTALRVVIARETADPPPSLDQVGRLWPFDEIPAMGEAFRMRVIAIWPRSERLDGAGRLRPYFPRVPGDYSYFWPAGLPVVDMQHGPVFGRAIAPRPLAPITELRPAAPPAPPLLWLGDSGSRAPPPTPRVVDDDDETAAVTPPPPPLAMSELAMRLASYSPRAPVVVDWPSSPARAPSAGARRSLLGRLVKCCCCAMPAVDDDGDQDHA